MNREKHFHPLAALHLLRKTLLVYLLPLVQVLFDRNWDALRAALRQELVLLFFISAVCWAVYYGGRWQVDAEGTVHVSWRLGVRLDRALRAEGLAALVLEQPLLYRLTGACRVVLYPVGQTKTITLYLTRQQAEELADVLLPVTDPLWHAPKGGEKLAFTVLGANGLSTLILWWLAIHQTQSYAPDAQTAALAQLGQLAAFAARWLPLGTAWLLVLAGTLFCISLVRSALQAVHYTVWRTDTQLGSRGGLVRRYEMRLRLCQLNYADLRRSPATWALHYCPVFVSAGACRPELPLFVWREGTPLLRELLPENLRQTLKKQRRILIHYRGRPNKNGREFFEVQVTRLDTAHGECKALIGFHHIDDIVRENRKHQEELEKALMEATLNNEIVSAISKIYVAIYRIDLKQDFYEEISSEQSIHRLTGMAGKASSQMNTLCNTFVVPEYHDRVKKFFDLKTLPERMTHEETIAIEYPATDGNWHLARFIAKNRDKDGTVTKVLYVTQLISDEKRREQFWIVAAEEANQANAAKSAFLSRMSHDIRTPMNVIMGLVSIAQNHLGDPDRVRDSLEKIQTTGRNLQQLVNDVLDIGQIESGEFKIRAMPMDLNELITDLRETLQSTAPERGIKWECKVHDLVRNWVCSDSLRLSQVFTNLISNAVKYTPEGGAVALEFFEEPAGKPDRVRFVGIVRDTGIGMTSEFMKDMYQEFSRAVDTRVNKIRGSGLGLAIVKKIVDMMNGDISVDSHPGRGSVFRVTLEMEYLDKAPVEETPAEADNGRCDGLRLLIAEDGDLSYEIEAELLEDRGAKCTRAENGQRCVELFRDAPAGTFDAILMDMQMPVMDGPNAARAIRGLDRPDAKTIPIIALTANAYREDVDVCVAAGMNAHLAKPLSVDKVVAALRKYQKQKDHT